MSHLPLDARAILQYLNDLGYRNISAEQLREFLKDLRKLIKYEERLAENAKEGNFRGLHKRGTVSSRAKLSGEKDKENAAPLCPCSSAKENESKTDQDDDQQQRSGGGAGFADLARLFKEKLLLEASVPPPATKALLPEQSQSNGKRRSRSKTRQEKEPPVSSGESEGNDRPIQRRRRSKSHPRSAVRRRGKSRHCDPVALFQYYQKEWAHFRSQIPGENAHMRHKLMDLKK
ncbi:uncharacterized protein LOC108046035 [Drosophila rhopaloa]|uniref:Uncharacterized protein LOC108046035 n=1 Tax=Drosophila rhopaloa TaxID=1041015 RepID=A0A6P4F169_DRORH|nr:uncharacterized protein LOC108046035 [Drosophila rhopaloa]